MKTQEQVWAKKIFMALYSYRQSYKDPSDLHVRLAIRKRLFQLVDDGPRDEPGNPAGREEER